MRLADHVDFQVVSHAGFLEIGSELAVDEADGGEVLDTGKAQVAQLLKKGGNVAEGICAADAGDDWCVFDYGEDFICLCMDVLALDLYKMTMGRLAIQSPSQLLLTMSTTMPLASPYGIKPDKDPRPAMRKRPLL